jgi:hypothetical protein
MDENHGGTKAPVTQWLASRAIYLPTLKMA